MTSPRTTLLEQLGRYWAEKTAATTARVFCEPAASTPAHLYARPLPDRSHRQATACSLTLSPSPAPEPNGGFGSVGVIAHAVAPTERAALDMLRELRDIIRPNDRPWVRDNAPHSGSFNMRGVVGVPPFDAVYGASGGGTPLWRLIDIQIVSEPQPFERGPGAGGHAGGQASAEMAFIVLAASVTMPSPLLAFNVWYSGANPTATIEITATKIILRDSVTREIVLGTAGTVQNLHTNWPTLAPGWTRAQLVQAVKDRPATDIFPRPEVSAKGSFEVKPLTVYA